MAITITILKPNKFLYLSGPDCSVVRVSAVITLKTIQRLAPFRASLALGGIRCVTVLLA